MTLLHSSMSRSNRTHIRHDAEAKDRWQQAAEARGLTLSEFLRDAADSAITGVALPWPAGIVYERMDPAKLRELRAIGNNLNQTTHRVHLSGNPRLAVIEALALDIRRLVADDLDKLRRSQATGGA